MQKNLDLRQKKVIDVNTAEQIGCIIDMDIDVGNGKIRSITVAKNGFLHLIHEVNDMTFSWDEVVAVGSEYILVKKIADKC